MTVVELIASLERMVKFNPPCSNAEVLTYDGDSGHYETITGFLYNPKDNTIELQTDSDEEEG